MLKSTMQLIDEMRSQGKSYTTIGSQLCISVNTIKTYCSRHKARSWQDDSTKNDRCKNCMYCGAPIEQNEKKRERKYCSSVCRVKWWNAHRTSKETLKHKHFICPICGRRFVGYGSRIYCSNYCHSIARGIKNG